MPSVLVALEESLSSLSQWRVAVSGHQHTGDEAHVPLSKSLLLPLACVAVFQTKLSPAQGRRYVFSVHASESKPYLMIKKYTGIFVCMFGGGGVWRGRVGSSMHNMKYRRSGYFRWQNISLVKFSHSLIFVAYVNLRNTYM
jgi:hypothetical protein